MQFGIISIAAAVAAFALTWLLGKFIIPWLERFGCGQNIERTGEKTYAVKSGAPTMGGLFVAPAVVVSASVFISLYAASNGSAGLSDVKIWAGLVMGVLFAALGFIDDYAKAVKKIEKGLGVARTVLEAGIIIFYIAALWLLGGGSGTTFIPFVGTVEIGVWYYILSAALIFAVINSADVTDGTDGLCSSVSFFAVIAFMMIASMSAMYDAGILAASVAGGCIGFFVYSFFPAKAKLGRTGTLFFGAMFCAVAFACSMPVLIPLAGIVYLCEGASLLIQKIYAKYKGGKKLMKNAPLHRHFEECGWNAVQISAVMSIAAFLAGIIAVMLAALGRQQ